MTDNSEYPKAYNQWAGNQKGTPPDFERCAQDVWDGWHSRQCGRKRGHGPGEAFCRQHAAINAERAAINAERAAINAERAAINAEKQK